MTGDSRIEWPYGRDFAFTIFDDTDLASLDRLMGVYDLLRDLGFRITKSVWPLAGDGDPRLGGATCEDEDYLAWVLRLQAEGFEIGYHGAAPSTSPRESVAAALDRFHELFGHYPMSMANHGNTRESIYWGPERVTGVNRVAFDVLTRFRRHGTFRGHVRGDPLFWGDLCAARVRYVRNFTFPTIDTLEACPQMPYHDPARPFVNYWFAGSEGADIRAFNRCLAEPDQDRLEAAGGACVMYAHLAAGFLVDGRPEPRFRRLMERLAGRNGWFVPVTTLLDYVRHQRGERVIMSAERRDLERRWLAGKILRRSG